MTRVLVIEDNRDLAENIRELFEEEAAEVQVCEGPEEARSCLARGLEFDVAIVDVGLPGGISGIELVPELRRAAPSSEVILITGNATLGSAMAAVRHGCFAYLQKPFDPEDLVTLGARASTQVGLRRERTSLAQELARSEALHRAVFDTVGSMIVGLDNEHRVQLWNRAASEITGYPAEQVLGEDACELLLEPRDRGAFDEALKAARRGEVRTMQLELHGAHERPRTLLWRTAPLLSEGADDPLVLAVGDDLTERLALEARAAEAEAMAAMGRLTAGLAHEIRNPLNAASLQLELIARATRRLDDEGVREKLEGRTRIVKDELARLSRMLDDFLGLARPRMAQPKTVDLETLLGEVASFQTPLVEASGCSLDARVAESTPSITGDAAQLKQALVNLIGNALDAMQGGPGTEIALTAGPIDDGWVEVRVDDRGPGISEDIRSGLFQPFVTTKPAGTGLGLPIVKKIAEQHGGQIEVRPRADGGTSARLILPVKKGER